jgi:hypothetical protein
LSIVLITLSSQKPKWVFLLHVRPNIHCQGSLKYKNVSIYCTLGRHFAWVTRNVRSIAINVAVPDDQRNNQVDNPGDLYPRRRASEIPEAKTVKRRQVAN